ncbi:tudor domain-containing 6 isoform X2 [Triplophysa dalaica]|uniref:tudor domain-containing 6 isoform X2 n=1 Tax=Triplophysa dalaica TaxID=1582913 RepID=UPI0024DFC7DA|nr:tudor domain-containing 6 isoform X2 [Triplophysa dalaica]
MCSIPGLPSTGSNVPVLISRVNLNPSCVLVEFWGNFDQDRKFAYQQLKKEIQYPREGFRENDGNPGDLCLVRVYETWYRARVVSRDAEEYSVFLIDEGRTLQATLNTLAWGKSEFFYLPPEVEFCVLANVLPLSPENKWTTMALEFMKTFCSRRVTATVQDVLVPHRTFLLDIPCLSRQMFEMGFAKKLSSERFKEFVTRSLQANSGSAVDLQKISFIGNKPLELIEQMEKSQSYMYPELQTDTVETVVVTEVTNPFHIFCQLKVFSQELRKLTEQITLHYEGRLGTNFARPENLGSPCASRGSDGKWYRSVLQQVMSANNVVEVLHVDYGKKLFVQVDNIRPLAPEFFRMPVVTYVCSLHGIVDRGVGWKATQIDFLKSLLLNRTVIAKFQYLSLSEGVHYVTLYGEENTNINKLFELKQKCVLGSDMTHDDFAVKKSPLSQRSKMSERSETKHPDGTYSDPKGNKPVFFTESLPPNTSHVAVVQHVDSPGKFWVQTQRYAEDFDQLMYDLGLLYNDPTSTEGLIRKPVAGLLCAAKAQDGVFYRAAIYKVIDKKAEVYFLDYGNTEIVDCCNLQQLPLKFQELPAVAVKCSLHGIKPKLTHWDEKATLFFSRIVEDKVLDLHVQDKFQDTHIVQLVEPSLDGENDASKLLCSADLAESEKNFVGKPALRSCSLKISHTADTVRTSTQPQTPSSSSVATESASAFKECLFPIGSSLEVTVSYIESPNDFWCQKAQNAACLEVLMQDIQRIYAHSKFQPPFEAACVACHPETGIWYRALVIHKHQTPHVDVLFIDYGQTTKVGVEDLRKITPEFLKMKGQAFRCSLYNLIHPVSHSAIDWSPEATLQFQDFVDTAASTNVPLKCTIFAVMYDAQKVVFNVVDLETPFQSICNLLVQRHLADRAPSKRSPISPFRLDTYYYSTHDIKTGCEEEVSVTCVKSATQFFCHLGRNSDQIEKLADKVNSLCTQLAVTKCPQTFGTVCFVKFTDGLWYRGQIKSTKPSIVVHFVDYGNTMEVNKSCLLPVPIEAGDIMTVPVQAIECGLSDIPDNVPGEVGKWFQNFAEGGCFKALIVAKEPEGKLIVELYDGKMKVNALIRQKFHNEIPRNELGAFKDYGTKNKNAQSLATHVRESFSGLTTNTPDMVQHFSQSQRGNGFESTRNRWGVHKDGGPEPTKDFQRCHNSTRPEISQRKPNESTLPCQSKKDDVKIEPQTSLKESQLPVQPIKPGMEASVFISHCNSPFSFFVQLATDEDDIYSLVEKLNDGHLKDVNLKRTDIHEGDLVRALFPDDNSWYRAVVRKNTGDTINVDFVDFGNTAAVSPSKICQLEQSFASFPRYSIHCSLNKHNVDRTDQASSFKQVIEENVDKVMCTFVKLSHAVWEVKLDVNGVVLGSTCKDESPPTAELKSTSVKQMSDVTTCTYYKNPDLSVGQMINGYASVIKGPQLFWCQYATDKLQEIADVLQNVGDVLENTLKEDSLPVGSAGIAIFAEDNLWYRAKVTNRDHDTLSVTFVDYGNESKVNVGDVRALPSKLSDIPPQAFDCQLEGFDASNGFWDEKADDEFYELVNDKLLNVNVERMGTSDMPHFVKLECDGFVINDIMLQYWKSPEGPSVELINGGELVPYEDSLVTDINIGSEGTLEADIDVTDETCTPDLKIQQEEETDVPEGTGFENEVRAVPFVMGDENVHSPDLIIVTQELVSECDTEHKPIADFTSSLLEPTNQHDFGHETLVDSTLHPPVLAQQSAELSDAAPKNDTDDILQQELDSELCPVEPEGPVEIIQSDFGCVRQATEKKPVGSECVIWSHVRRNWCKAQILKVSEDDALVLLVDHDSEVVVDPLNIYEILPEKLLEPLSGEASALDDELTKGMHPAQIKIVSQAEDAEYEAPFGISSDDPKGHESCKRLVEQMDPGDKQLQAEEPVSCSEGLVEVSEEVSGAGAQLVEILNSTAYLEHLQNREPQDDTNSSAGEQKGGENNMVDLLMDFLDVEILEKVQEDVCQAGSERDALLEEFNSVTADLLVLTSDDGAESDTGSDGTLQGDRDDAEEYSCVQERPNASDCTSAEEQDLRVTHLTLKVEDQSDDVIFVGVLQESQAEVCQPEQK